MAGKKKTDRNKNKKWGGLRKGAGRKSAYAITDNQVEKMLRAAKARAKRNKSKTVNGILLDHIYDSDPKVSLAGIKLFKEYTMSKKTEKHVKNEDIKSPVIGLPEMEADPALKIVKGGKKE